jgi:C1A family cysteine protease
MNVLLIHGVDTNEDTNPYGPWIIAITDGLKSANFGGPLNPIGLNYNDLFDKHSSNILLYGAAVIELLATAAWHTVTAPRALGAAPAPEQPSDDFLSQIRWSAGMVAQWVVEDGLRSDLRDRLFNEIQSVKPDVIFAHSLGSLLCYDFFANDARGKTAFQNGTFITFGSQIGNTFVKDRMWNGQVEMIPVARWINLYNPNDPVFVASLDVLATSFYQFVPVFGSAPFDSSAHEATQGSGHPGYLDNPVTDKYVWPLLAGGSMASLIERNMRIMKRTPKDVTSAVTLLASPHPETSFVTRIPRPGKKTRKHTYRYHPPRADHPLLKSAPRSVKLAELPVSVDLRNRCLAIRDQGQEGACSGFASAAFREASHAVGAGNPLSFYLSPAYLYGRSRIFDGTFPRDSGASVADEFWVLQNYGVCPETYLPYTADPSEGPTPVADTAAFPFRIAQPLQVDWHDPQSLKSVLANEQTITIGFLVYVSFENPDDKGVVPIPNTGAENLLGGHGVLVCGYDDVASWWIIRNHWGQSWGAAGYCYMPYGYESVWTEAWTAIPTP